MSKRSKKSDTRQVEIDLDEIGFTTHRLVDQTKRDCPSGGAIMTDIRVPLPKRIKEEPTEKWKKMQWSHDSVTLRATDPEILKSADYDVIKTPATLSFFHDDSGNLMCTDGETRFHAGKFSQGSALIKAEETIFELKVQGEHEFHESLTLAASGVSPYSRTCSPSALLHNACSLMIMKTVTTHESVYEPRDVYLKRPDVLLIDDQGRRLVIEVSTESTSRKLRNCRKSYGSESEGNPAIAVINKYSITRFGSERVRQLHHWSRQNDRRMLDTWHHIIEKQEKCFDRKSYITNEVRRFFALGTDQIGRSMDQHSKCANAAFKRIYREAVSLSSSEISRIQASSCQLSSDQFIKVVMKCRELCSRTDSFMEKESSFFSFPAIRPIEADETAELEPHLEGHDLVTDRLTGRLQCRSEGNPSKRRKLSYSTPYITVNDKAFENLTSYSDQKVFKTYKYVKNFFRVLADAGGSVNRALSRVCQEINASGRDVEASLSEGYILIRKKKSVPAHQLRPSEFHRTDVAINQHTYSLMMLSEVEIDPEHALILQAESYDTSMVLRYLKKSRVYHELRILQKLATEIVLSCSKPGPQHVDFSLRRDVHAEFLHVGKSLTKDQGFTLVSFYHDGLLYKTERWQATDVKLKKISALRLTCILCCLARECRDESVFRPIADMISVLLKENSWASSKHLKAHKYAAYGAAVASPKFGESLIKALDEALLLESAKLSTRMYADYLLRNIARFRERGHKKTPLFNLPYRSSSFEYLLMNVCPSETYGRAAHLTRAVQELLDEIKLEMSHENEIRTVMQHFEEILCTNEPLENLYYDHFKLQEHLSEVTDGRFTFSPSSIVMIQPILKDKVKSASLSNSAPELHTLMTSKGSFDSTTGQSMMAAVSLERLMTEYRCETLPELVMSILSKSGVPDMSMKMFDKSQVGGDREISVMSNEMRLLLACSEHFFRRVNTCLGNEYLHNRNKVQDLVMKFEEVSKMQHPLFLSVDQKRWCANFNTETFSLLALTLRRSTESFIPALICSLSSMSIFQTDKFRMDFDDVTDQCLSISGQVARYHMGQGIHHCASSCYHAAVTHHLSSIIREVASEDSVHVDLQKQMVFESLITSDDASLLLGCKDTVESGIKDKVMNDEERRLRLKRCSDYMFEFAGSYAKLVKYYGIKTSAYKNVVSQDSIEFNSIYISTRGPSRPTLKFAYSLIDANTTGSITDDLWNSYSSACLAINSLVGSRDACTIARCNLVNMFRTWNLSTGVNKLPSERDLIKGLPMFYRNESCAQQLYERLRLSTPSSLNFKKKFEYDSLIERRHDSLSSALIASKIESIAASRKLVTHTALRHYHPGPFDISTHSDLLELNFAARSVSYNAFIKMVLEDSTNLLQLHNSDIEHIAFPSTRMREIDSDFSYNFRVLRESSGHTDDILSVLSNVVDCKSVIERGVSTYEDLMLHLLRLRKGNVSVVSEPLQERIRQMTSLSRKIEVISGMIAESSSRIGGCVQMIYRKAEKEDEGERLYPSYFLPNLHFGATSRSVVEFKRWINSRDCNENHTSRYNNLSWVRKKGNAVACEFTLSSKRSGFIPLSEVSTERIVVPRLDLETLKLMPIRTAVKECLHYYEARGVKSLYIIRNDGFESYLEDITKAMAKRKTEEGNAPVQQTKMNFDAEFDEIMDDFDLTMQSVSSQIFDAMQDADKREDIGSDDEWDDLDERDMPDPLQMSAEKKVRTVGVEVPIICGLHDPYFIRHLTMCVVVDMLFSQEIIFPVDGPKELSTREMTELFMSGELDTCTMDRNLPSKVKDLIALSEMSVAKELSESVKANSESIMVGYQQLMKKSHLETERIEWLQAQLTQSPNFTWMVSLPRKFALSLRPPELLLTEAMEQELFFNPVI